MVVDEGIHQNLDPSPVDSGASTFNSFLTTGDTYCLLLITYASNFDPDQDRLKKDNFEKKASTGQQSMKHYPACKKLKKGLTHVRYVRLDDEQSNALARLRSWSGSHVPSLVSPEIST